MKERVPMKTEVLQPDEQAIQKAAALLREGDLVGMPTETAVSYTHLGIQWIHTNQGYARCSTCVVDETSVVTSDEGIAAVLEQEGIEVLRIRPGFVRLPGYDTGFIGGCCGKIGQDLLYFTGKLSSHPDGETIRAFAEQRGVHVVEGAASALLDIGGILPLTQRSSQ